MCEAMKETRVLVSFSYQLLVSGSWLGGHVVAVRVGSHESSVPFSFVLDGDRPVQFRKRFGNCFPEHS